jgi:hypothetical protein
MGRRNILESMAPEGDLQMHLEVGMRHDCVSRGKLRLIVGNTNRINTKEICHNVLVFTDI